MIGFIRKLFERPASASHQYRLVRRLDGWEPQMSYTAGLVDGVKWYPLNADGYWLEPDAFTNGNPSQHISLPKAAAERALLRAQAINGLHIKEQSEGSHDRRI